jgi:hypothetical protein
MIVNITTEEQTLLAALINCRIVAIINEADPSEKDLIDLYVRLKNKITDDI